MVRGVGHSLLPTSYHPMHWWLFVTVYCTVGVTGNRMRVYVRPCARVRVRACVCVCECVRVYINEVVFPCPFLGRRLSWACPSLCYDPPWSSVSTKLTLDTLFPDQTHLGHSNIVQQSGCSSSFRLDLWVALTIHHPLVAYDNLKHTADSPGIS